MTGKIIGKRDIGGQREKMFDILIWEMLKDKDVEIQKRVRVYGRM